MRVTRQQVLDFRVHAQQLDLADDARNADVAILDLGVQDSGPDGARWALALRGWHGDPDDLLTAWTLRGAPHVYRRGEAAKVAAAVAPMSEADAAKRVFDAAKKLRAADLAVLDALDRVADEMRDVASGPVVKGTMSGELSRRLPDAYLRHCTPCDAVHVSEQTFRIAALRGGIELEAGTSPPVLRRVPGWRGRAARVSAHLDVVRGLLRFLGPVAPRHVAAFLDAPVKDVKEHWPDDVVEIEVEGETRSVLAADLDALLYAPHTDAVRLLGPFDLFLQARDRELVVPDAAARKDLWRVLGRPGAVLVGGEVVGSWRPRSKGAKLGLVVTTWNSSTPPAGLAEQADRLAAVRGQAFSGFVDG